MPEMTRYQMRMSETEKRFLYAKVTEQGYKDITDLLLSLVKNAYPDFPRELRREGNPTFYADRHQLVARLVGGEIQIAPYGNDNLPSSVWRTLRADTPVKVEIYLDGDADWLGEYDEEQLLLELRFATEKWHRDNLS
jgi:hypothetical protein